MADLPESFDVVIELRRLATAVGLQGKQIDELAAEAISQAARVGQLERQVAELDSRLADYQAWIEKLEAEAAAQPARTSRGGKK